MENIEGMMTERVQERVLELELALAPEPVQLMAAVDSLVAVGPSVVALFRAPFPRRLKASPFLHLGAALAHWIVEFPAQIAVVADRYYH